MSDGESDTPKCVKCSRPLRPTGPSDDFCSDHCQVAWYHQQAGGESIINEFYEHFYHASLSAWLKPWQTFSMKGCAATWEAIMGDDEPPETEAERVRREAYEQREAEKEST